MNIQPLADRVLLKAIQKDNITASGIYLMEGSNKERPYMYEVVAVGPGKDGEKMEVKVGDKVLSGQYSWDDVKVDGEEYKIVAQQYILAVVQD